MSHYTVLVVHNEDDDIDSIMAPYAEQDADEQYLEFVNTEDEELKKYNSEGVVKVKTADGRWLYEWDREFKGADILNPLDAPADLERKEFKFKELFATFEEYMVEWCGQSSRDEDEGVYGYKHNPNAKWDWYQVGGRWAGFFKVKDGVKGTVGKAGVFDNAPKFDSDVVRKGDIDWDNMRATLQKEASERWDKYEEALKNGTLKDGDAYWTYGVEKDQTKEEYLMEANVSTFAIVKDGKWYQKGEMGWWGMASNEKKADVWVEEWNKLIDALPDDTMLTVLDCHI